ncbi:MULTISPECIES: hypothetical protein [Staphylococcus]|uniref:hypothetical protein n=1 Tax=Staphylococcus TaxID=1279 RepID=UPI0002463DC1|nr:MULTISPECIES: hypothetical protein [Staphylococcus]QAV30216.1 hypothetical protein SD1155_00955 [Sulfitobacter donghicola]AGZ25049.1 hypothetical protein STP1_0739 [Staphylococcus pasteuri SP1]KAB7645317.1 hypothetical protein F9280_07965 [Staphylococcus sp. B2-b]MBN6853087.1 hypothetical protein [Staphylococcus warneri]MBT2769498.1 hypothetical protein [Staphylococcus warneri]
MRPTLIVLFIVFNLIAIFNSVLSGFTIDYFSLKVIIAAFTLVLSILFLLIRTTYLSSYLSILSIIVACLHIAIIIQSAYNYLY